MTQASGSKVNTFDQDDLNKTTEKARQKAIEILPLCKESECDQASGFPPARESIEIMIRQIKHEPLARQMRTVLEKFLGEKIHFNELTQEIEVCGESIKAYEFDIAEHWFDERFGIMGTKG